MGEATSPRGCHGTSLDDIFSSDTEDEVQSAAKMVAQKAKGESLKAKGNRLLQEGNLKEAIATYKRALTEIWALYRCRADEQARQLGLAIDLNLALCHLRLQDWQNARVCASRALEVDSNNAKGLFRRGVAAARLRDWDAAEVDLKAAVDVQAGPEAKRELANVKRQLQAERSVVKGFLQREGAAADDTGADVEKQTRREDEEPEEQEEQENLEGEWVDGGEVLEELRQICEGLAAIAQRRILCESSDQRDAIREQLALANVHLCNAKAAGDAATLTGESAGYVNLEDLFDNMASGLGDFRPFFQLQEKVKGEFDSLRIVRKLPGANTKLTMDVEMVLWGNDGLATSHDFAAPVFPPSGRPRTDEEAEWQRQLFARFLQKDASKYVAGATFMVLQELLRLGYKLVWDGRIVVDLGLAHGLFFAAPHAGVQDMGDVGTKLRSQNPLWQDGLAVCAGKDKRQILVPSFTSLGVVHKWLLLALSEDSEEEEDGGQGRTEVAVDLCAGGLGLLPEPPNKLVNSWPAHGDARFLVRCERWGEDAHALIQGPLVAKGGDLMRAALEAVMAVGGEKLPFTAEALLRRQVPSGPHSAMPSGKDSRAEAARRLRLAARSLGLPAAFAEGRDPVDERQLEELMKEAVTECARCRLQKAGLLK